MDSIGQPPEGGDRNLGPALIAVNCVLFIASTLVVILRSITRLWITRNFGIDDAFMVVTQMANSCGMGFVGAEVSNGLGRHRYYLAPGAYKKYLKYDYLDWVQVFFTLALSKIAICLFLLRLSEYRKLRLWLYGLIVLLVTTHVPLTFLIIFQCSPIRKYWVSPLEGPGVCFTKATVETIIIAQGALSGQVKSSDVTWEGLPNAIARMFEINLGIIAACAPIMKPLYRYLYARATGKDPREVLYRTRTPSVSHTHTTWYKRWRFGSRGYRSRSSKSLQANPFHYPSVPPLPEQDSVIRQSLHLPLQGLKVEAYIEGETSVLHEEHPTSNLQSDWGLAYEVQERV
ncbi:MAG: hypothetical protein Q9196_002951 [Gyalolechia fulgens]